MRCQLSSLVGPCTELGCVRGDRCRALSALLLTSSVPAGLRRVPDAKCRQLLAVSRESALSTCPDAAGRAAKSAGRAQRLWLPTQRSLQASAPREAVPERCAGLLSFTAPCLRASIMQHKLSGTHPAVFPACLVSGRRQGRAQRAQQPQARASPPSHAQNSAQPSTQAQPLQQAPQPALGKQGSLDAWAAPPGAPELSRASPASSTRYAQACRTCLVGSLLGLVLACLAACPQLLERAGLRCWQPTSSFIALSLQWLQRVCCRGMHSTGSWSAGQQPQRISRRPAAQRRSSCLHPHLLSLLTPGTPLLPWAAHSQVRALLSESAASSMGCSSAVCTSGEAASC